MGNRKPPTALKLLNGNPSQRKLTPEPKPLTEVPKMPIFVKRNLYARREWERLIPELEKVGLISLLDRSAIAAYCMAYATYEELSRYTNTLKPADEKYLDYTRATRQAAVLLKQYLSDFGMTPSSRTKVVMNRKPGESENEFDKWEKGKKV